VKKVLRREIPRSAEAALWGMAAGRCEFNGCSRPLWKSPVTQETVNVAEKAHIYAFSPRGPRGNAEIDPDHLNHPENLLLVCHDCHRTIDKTIKDGGRYPPEFLRAWKREHEERIAVAGAIAPDRRSHVLLYGANIGEHSSPLHFADAARAMFPARYPAQDRAIELGMRNSAIQDNDSAYWKREAQNLVTLFENRVRVPLADGLIHHLSVFALAPQPLLLLLGALLIDIAPADVYQRRREPSTWSWGEGDEPFDLIVREPTVATGPPALILSVSATINVERVHAVDPNLTIWEVTIDGPHNDVLQTTAQLRSFRQTVRGLLDRIKARHGEHSRVSIFPAVPVACAVELGRVRMPKADLPWRVYDQIPSAGFVPALDLPLDRRPSEVVESSLGQHLSSAI
jgi:hypothetical protein